MRWCWVLQGIFKHQRDDLLKKQMVNWTSFKQKNQNKMNFYSAQTLSKEWEEKLNTGTNGFKRNIWLRTAIQNIQRTLKT